MTRGFYNANISAEQTDAGLVTQINIAIGGNCILVRVVGNDYTLSVVDYKGDSVTQEFYSDLHPTDSGEISCRNLPHAFELVDRIGTTIRIKFP